MSNSLIRSSVFSLLVVIFAHGAWAQTSPKPLHASEVVALEAGGVLQTNVAHEIGVRGLNFHPDADYLALLRKAGADATVLDALAHAKVVSEASNEKPDKELPERLSRAAAFMKDKRYDEAAAQLSSAVKEDFAGIEAGFVMGELLNRQEEWPHAASVYAEILQESPDFPQVHTKLSFALYKLGDPEGALREAKAALAQNPEDAEAHKNAGLALDDSQEFEAAASEYREALRLKPDYAMVHFDLGLLLYHRHDYDSAIDEYKKAISLDPDFASSHTNLGITYAAKGDIASAIREGREAKRLNPNDAWIRQNLASTLMHSDPQAAAIELQELAKLFPDFEVCHVCLGSALRSTGNAEGAQAEYRKAIDLNPSDPEPHMGLGNLEEDKFNFAEALKEYRIAGSMDPELGRAHRNIGRVLLAKMEAPTALAELEKAAALSPSDWETHDLYGQALEGSGDNAKAVVEFKHAISLDPSQYQAILELASVLEKNGDWVSALEQYRKAELAERSANANHPAGEPFLFSKNAEDGHKAAQLRYQRYLASLKAEGKAAKAAELEKQVQAMDAAPTAKERIELVMQEAEGAYKENRFEAAEKFYKQAVELAEKLPSDNQLLIEALGRLGATYGMRQQFTDAEVTINRQLQLVEKTIGPYSPQMLNPLFALGSMAGYRKDYAGAEKYFERILDINLKTLGENSERTSQSLGTLAGLYMAQGLWEKAEPYMLRAVKSEETASGTDAFQVVLPLWGLCGMYDMWNKPEKSQPCWHRLSAIAEKKHGESDPTFQASLANEAKVLRKLGRNDEAGKLEQRSARIQKTSALAN